VGVTVRGNSTLINCISGFILYGSSDAIAQEIEYRTRTKPNPCDLTATSKFDEFNVWRCLSASLLGIFYGGYAYPYAYAQLDKVFKGVRWDAVLKKSVTEMFTVGIFVNSTSMLARGYLTRHEDVAHHVLQEMPRVTYNDFRIFMPYNFVAFGFIPIWIRPSTTALMEAGWQTYVSLRSNDYSGKHETRKIHPDGVSSKRKQLSNDAVSEAVRAKKVPSNKYKEIFPNFPY
jgi:hypothetical protein